MMRLIEVVAHLTTPAVIGDELHLDGLLAQAHPLCRQHPIGRTTPADDLIDPPLPVMQLTSGGLTIRLCSSAQYAEAARVTTSRFVKRRDDEDLMQRARPINLALGPEKNRMGRLPLVVSPTVTWYAVGDRRGVIRLLQRVTHLGSWRASGYGFISRVEVTRLETETPETVLVAGGVAQRHLPASWCEWAASEMEGPLVPPYWHPARQHERIVRAGTKCALRPAIIAAVRDAADAQRQNAHRTRHKVRNARALEAASDAAGRPLSNRARRALEKYTDSGPAHAPASAPSARRDHSPQ